MKKAVVPLEMTAYFLVTKSQLMCSEINATPI